MFRLKVLCCFLHIIRSMPCLLASVCYSCGGTVESAVFCFVFVFYTNVCNLCRSSIGITLKLNMGTVPAPGVLASK